MMTYLRNSIIATVVYHDTFNYPLTLLEVFKYLINPGRLMRIADGLGEIKLDEVSEELDRLIKSGILAEKNGFYFLNGRDDLYDLRIERQKIADKKWKKFLKLTKFLALTPFLRGVFASGSMALGNTDKESDFDVLIIAKSGRLYTCRLFLWLISSLLGARRKKHEKVAPDKFCFNHYITDDSLELRHQSLFNAQTYINLKPAMIKPELVNKFFSSNLWLNNYVYNFKIQSNFVMRSVLPPHLFIFLARMEEFTINLLFGNSLERFLMNDQQKRIKKNPITYEPGGRIVSTEKELEFHPRSFEQIVIEKYNRGLKHLGIIPYSWEKDSGLKE
ncbi:MAG: hypothetical protein A3F98_03465 [Candidatus Yanofskybacteria bacterium RIFCSPLOWO2_12_FULL_41_8]|uniref:Polymerase nucleotidyl transferase domain-containing protein n=1 Tax=Candidatus Yanofskybacteria bacterium RIFCSPHIGHO2_01_FULL_41_53 TaxID=1802663 RepID=A0A1F8EHC3_9BACT|nr:MAG: hypothetical protein A2650_02845 [Candidatus Yanofskybacteria bacterium RIFCSPHIGHO2_01_FULL_41_53]OGN35818.1 MAG: hypothetical protein A3F98_03465 [Candidatus Yanofskybacteria bacterium RIFCSPLOWO2_12_FULL_41_8]